MSKRALIRPATFLVLGFVLFLSPARLGHCQVYWHMDPGVKICSMVIDPSLTQGEWHRFTQQASAIVTFKSLAPANTLGKWKFYVAVEDMNTPVNQHDGAWINTFTHPDESCPLGDAISFPSVRARMGVSDRLDVGGYWTTAPQANYGLVGGELKYALLQESKKYPAAALRGSFTVLTGVSDFDINIYSLELLASKKITVITPYAGIRQSLAVGSETTSKVNLDTEAVPITQGYVGAAYSIWKISLAAEYNISFVNTLAFAIGFNP